MLRSEMLQSQQLCDRDAAMRQGQDILFRNFRVLRPSMVGFLGLGWAVSVIATQSLRRWCYSRNEGPMITDAAVPRQNVNSPMRRNLTGERRPRGTLGDLQGSHIQRPGTGITRHEMASENTSYLQVTPMTAVDVYTICGFIFNFVTMRSSFFLNLVDKYCTGCCAPPKLFTHTSRTTVRDVTTKVSRKSPQTSF